MRLYIDIPLKRKSKIYINILVITFLIIKAPSIYWYFRAESEIKKYGGRLSKCDILDSFTKHKHSLKSQKANRLIVSTELIDDFQEKTISLSFIKYINDLDMLSIFVNDNYIDFHDLRSNKLISLEIFDAKQIDEGSTLKIANNKLKVLTLHRSEIDNIIFAKNSRLEILDLSNSQIKNIQGMDSLIKLKELNLTNAGVKDISLLKDCKNLAILDLSSSQIKSIQGIEFLCKLKELNLANAGVTDISLLEKCKDLEILDIHGTRVSDLSPLKRLLKLRRLSFSTDGDLNLLKDLKSLKELNIWYDSSVINVNSIKDKLEKISALKTQLKEIKKSLPKCKIYSNFKEGEWAL